MIKKVPQLNLFLRHFEILRSFLGKKVLTLVLGDSILAQVKEDKISIRKSIKARYLLRAKMLDFRYYAVPLLKKHTDNIILQIGINDAPY